jgi:SAM-dependent methyltransferase
MSAPSRRLTLTTRQRARRLAWRTSAHVRALGVAPGLRPYRPEPWAVTRWERAYTSGEFHFMSDLYELPRYSLLIGYLRLHPGTPSVLDIGCGPGRLRELLAEGEFDTYVGIDLSAEAIKSASRLSDHRTDFMVGDAMVIDLPATDIVVLNEMIYYMQSPRTLLERVASVLRPGGLVLTSIWRHPGDRALWRLLDGELQLVSAARTRTEGNRHNRLGWRVSCHRVSGDSA